MPPLLQMTGIEKSFPGVKALKGVNFDLRAGEVHALMGENGAGKSTLIKVLGGAHQPNAGTMTIGEEVVSFAGPADSQNAGVGVIYQEFNLVPALSARENIFLGRELHRGGLIRKVAEREQALDLFRRIGVEIDPDTPCQNLTVAQQQIVEIAKALALEVRILVMDEPTAALSGSEVECLFDIIAELKAQNIGIVYVSHRLEEIERIADRVTVFRDGAYVGTLERETTVDAPPIDRKRIIEMMVGRPLDQEFPPRERSPGDVRLVATQLSNPPRVKGISFEARGGEVLGLTGLVGAGRTETVRLIFGADRGSGSVTLDGEPLTLRSPRDAIRAGICLLTEDRKGQGLVLGQTVRENFGLPNLGAFSRGGVLNLRAEREAFAEYIEQLAIKVPHQETPARSLSGGNQQKVVLAKWLQRNAEVVIFDEPTRGIDVGAKYEIYLLINRLAAEGKVVIVISSELPEVLGICDRLLVLHEGTLVATLENDGTVTQEQIMQHAIG